MITQYLTGVHGFMWSDDYNLAYEFTDVAVAANVVKNLDPGSDGALIGITPDASGKWIIVRCSNQPMFFRRQAS
jgi:hypothetical protein